MFNYQVFKQAHFDNAYRAFANTYKGDLVQIAESIGMNTQMLRNKLNSEQPHQLESPKEWANIALNITLHDRWRRTFYSSRSERDNSGDLKYTLFDGDKVNGEPTFLDRVNGWDVTEIINVNNMIGHFECHDRWEEVILCKLKY